MLAERKKSVSLSVHVGSAKSLLMACISCQAANNRNGGDTRSENKRDFLKKERSQWENIRATRSTESRAWRRKNETPPVKVKTKEQSATRRQRREKKSVLFCSIDSDSDSQLKRFAKRVLSAAIWTLSVAPKSFINRLEIPTWKDSDASLWCCCDVDSSKLPSLLRVKKSQREAKKKSAEREVNRRQASARSDLPGPSSQ